MEYIHGLGDRDGDDGCFLCRYRDEPDGDAANRVVWRSHHALVVMNRFPYTNGHLLIAPNAHAADLDELDDDAFDAVWRATRDAKRMLSQVLNPQGFNVGLNFGRCAGAGLPGHLHIHIVPRWNGDTNFMAVLGDVRVIPQAMDRLWTELRAASAKMGLPTAGPGSRP